MSKQKITSFEELRESINKLGINAEQSDFIKKGIHLITLSFKNDVIKYKISYDVINNNYVLIIKEQGTRIVKDPQKIYNVIYAIKQCEVEDE